VGALEFSTLTPRFPKGEACPQLKGAVVFSRQEDETKGSEEKQLELLW
jgi:hypothetical protein